MIHVRNAWHVASWSMDLEVAKPFAITIANDRIVIARTESGTLFAFEDRCVHRLAPLWVRPGLEVRQHLPARRQPGVQPRHLAFAHVQRAAGAAAEGALGVHLAVGGAELSDREREILQLVVEGNSSAKIAAQLGLASTTVDTYRSRMMAKLHIDSLPDLVRFAIRQGLLPLD